MTTVIGEGDLYYFKQGAWRSLTGPVASGGTVTDIVDGGISYRVHTFTTSGDLVVGRGGEVEYLIVAGGGGGGFARATVVVAVACVRLPLPFSTVARAVRAAVVYTRATAGPEHPDRALPVVTGSTVRTRTVPAVAVAARHRLARTASQVRSVERAATVSHRPSQERR
jgi:hypothetical protein